MTGDRDEAFDELQELLERYPLEPQLAAYAMCSSLFEVVEEGFKEELQERLLLIEKRSQLLAELLILSRNSKTSQKQFVQASK